MDLVCFAIVVLRVIDFLVSSWGHVSRFVSLNSFDLGKLNLPLLAVGVEHSSAAAIEGLVSCPRGLGFFETCFWQPTGHIDRDA